MSDPYATLYILAGLPASGKTTIGARLARWTGAVFLRIDTIEQGLRDLCGVDVVAQGYELAYRLAADNLRLGRSVVADSCNPLRLTRDAWQAVANECNASYRHIEVVCSDAAEHCRRVEMRTSTVPNLKLPTWEEVVQREYHAWDRPRIEIDTAARSVEDCVDELQGELGLS